MQLLENIKLHEVELFDNVLGCIVKVSVVILTTVGCSEWKESVFLL